MATVAYQGTYTADLFNPSKRYRIGTGYGVGDTGGFQKGVALADSELREVQMVGDSFVRQLIHNNYSRGSSTNDGFKVVESSSPANNIKITGGDGTVNGSGVLFVDGFILFLKSDIEYTGQGNGGAITDDDYTETTIAALTTPGGPRTDEVYVDFYFAEVSNDAGSEYQDTSLAVSGIGSTTANRVRQVQDILVAEGGSTPADTTDGNGIAHKYIKIATLNRTAAANIVTGEIVDERTLINSNKSYEDGTALTIKLKDGEDIGDVSHKIDTIYMSSTINHASDLGIIGTGGVGIGTASPNGDLDVFNEAEAQVNVVATSTNDSSVRFFQGSNQRGAVGYDQINTMLTLSNGVLSNGHIVIAADGKVGISTSPTVAGFEVGGSALIHTNLTVNGTTTTINTETTVTDKMSITQDDAQVALEINKTNVSGGDAVTIVNSGTGNSLLIDTNVLAVNANGQIGIGTATAQEKFHLYDGALRISRATGTTLIDFRDSTGEAIRGKLNLNNNDDLELTQNDGTTPIMVWGNSTGNVGIGTDAPSEQLSVWTESSSTALSLGRLVNTNEIDVGRIHFLGLDSDNAPESYARISAKIRDNTAGAEIGDFLFYTTNLGSTTEKMRIKGNGTVGIGRTSPNATLHVRKENDGSAAVANTDTILILENNTNAWLEFMQPSAQSAGIRFSDSSAAQGIIEYAHNGNSMRFTTDASEKVRITSAGSVGIGTTSPHLKLDLEDAENEITGMEITNIESTVRRWQLGVGGNSPSNFAPKGFGIRDVTGGQTRFVINTSGNVGVGTINPTTLLDVADNSGNAGALRLRRVDTSIGVGNGLATISMGAHRPDGAIAMGASIDALSDGTWTNSSYPGYLQFSTTPSGGTNPSIRMTIKESGSVGIGTTSPDAPLHVWSGSVISGKLNSTIGGGKLGPTIEVWRTSTGVSNVCEFYNPNGIVGTIVTAGSATAYNTSSDERLKENIRDFENPIDKIKAIKPRTFKFKKDEEERDGLIAQEIMDILPYAVTGKPDEVDKDGKPVYMSIDYSMLTPLLVATIKDLLKRIENLEAKTA